MNIQKRVEITLKYLFIATVISTIVFRHSNNTDALKSDNSPKKVAVDQIITLFPDAKDITVETDSSLSVVDGQNKTIGKLIRSDIYGLKNNGYADDVPVMIAFDTALKILDVSLLANHETPSYNGFVKKKGLLKKWNGLLLTEAATHPIDAISRATYTSKAVISSVKQTSRRYLTAKETKTETKWDYMAFINQLLFVLVLTMAVSATFFKKVKKYRTIQLIFVVLIFGFISNRMLNTTLFYNWVENGIAWRANIQSLILLTLALVLPLLGKRKFYCMQLCPMGALQELVSKLSPFKKRRIRGIQWRYFNLQQLYFITIWGALLAGISLPLDQLEPFIAFSFSLASWFVIGFAVVALILSLFFHRPWCAVCPTGCALNLFEPPKKSSSPKK